MTSHRHVSKNVASAALSRLQTIPQRLMRWVLSECYVSPTSDVALDLDTLASWGVDRAQGYNALRKLQKKGMVEYSFNRDLGFYTVRLNTSFWGIRSGAQESKPSPSKKSNPPSPVPEPVAAPRSMSPAPTPVAQATAPISPAGIPAPMAAPDKRAPLTPERRNELCTKPPASFAALFDEVEPEWRIHTRADRLKQIEQIDNEYRPAQFSPYALSQLLKDSTKRPAAYLPKMFDWKTGKPVPDANHMTNVTPDDPTGHKRAQRRIKESEEMFARKPGEKELSPEAAEIAFAELSRLAASVSRSAMPSSRQVG